MSAIHQFVAGFTRGDAISNEAVVMRRIFRSWGYESDIFSEQARILPELRKEAREAADYVAACRPDHVVLLHLSIGSKVNDIFAGLSCRKAILYHNVTPAHYFSLLQKQICSNLERGREQVKTLAGKAEVNMADSRFNAAELAEAGYRDVQVLPLVLDFDKLRDAPDRRIMKRLNDGLVNVLFVGRCAPNKRIEDLLVACSVFQDAVQPNSRFIHVGSYAGLESYYYVMFSLARDLKLRNVQFAGAVPQAQLNAYYRSASLFLCMSEHEGFCIPLVESMVNNVPILAYSAGAVPETLDGSGVLFKEKDFHAVAEMMGRLVNDGRLRNAVIEGQRARLARFTSIDLEVELKGHLAPLLGT